ncbi:sodium-coupled monocarboxylate transporter 1-like [Haliotis cracherodii]|uniref:sodium-coupled monocarboxylate transporter 1-like n=1 Tax=Haliotis cracherodii TaxID=6455 RepID=UPI0039E89CFA
MEPEMQTFSWVDYLLFSLTLVFSASIGIFWSVKTRKKIAQSPDHLLTGDRKLQIFPVTMSLAASFLSAIFIIGVPTEVYVNGGMYVCILFSYIPTMAVASIFFVPMFHKLRYTSAYEYLERRFNKAIRIMGSLTFTVEMIIYMGVVMYTPSLALSQVTGLSMELCILTVGLVCTFYTTIGGIKAVVWTDVFQLFIITGGLLALVVQGAMDVGGLGKMFERATLGGRMPYFDFNPDPFVRNSFWTLNIGGFFTFLTVYASNQATLQRYSSVKTLKGAQLVLWLTLPIAVMNMLLICAVGLAIYARYHDCDPFLSGRIAKLDQIVPLYMMDTLGSIPGLPGLFVSCIFSASLSTVSSGVNSLAAVSICDYLKPALSLFGKKPSNKTLSVLSMVCSIFYGLLTVGLAYVAGIVGRTVLQIGLSVFGMLGGPLLGLFCNGMFFPFVNSWGAGAGLTSSLVVSLWLGVGAALNPAPRGALNLVTDGCTLDNSNVTTTALSAISIITASINSTSVPSVTRGIDILDKIYSLSYLHYSTVSVIVAIVVGIVVSSLTGCNREKPVDPTLYIHIRDGLCSYKQCLAGYTLAPTDTSLTEAHPAPYALPYMVNGDYSIHEKEHGISLLGEKKIAVNADKIERILRDESRSSCV